MDPACLVCSPEMMGKESLNFEIKGNSMYLVMFVQCGGT